MKRLLFVLTIALVALSLNSAPVAAQTGNTDVDITLDGIIILHYFDNVDVTISANEMGAFLLGGPGNTVNEGTVVGTPLGNFAFDLSMDPDTSLVGDPSDVLLTLVDAWAVRSIGTAATQTQLAITITDNTLAVAAPSTATMTITDAAVDNVASNGATIAFDHPGLVDAEMGDVELSLDMTNATEAGIYADGVFTLTASFI